MGPSAAQGLLLAWNRQHCRAVVCLVDGVLCSGSRWLHIALHHIALHVLCRAWLVLTECPAGYDRQPEAPPVFS